MNKSIGYGHKPIELETHYNWTALYFKQHDREMLDRTGPERQ